MGISKKIPQTVDAYVDAFPSSTKKLLQQLRRTIRAVLPDAKECIKYGIPTFSLSGKNVVHIAGHARHIGFYPTPSAITAFEKELSPYVCSKGAVQFPLDAPLPLGLIRRIVQFRRREVVKNLRSQPAH